MSCSYTVSSLDLPKPYIPPRAYKPSIPLRASLALELFPLAKNVTIPVLGCGRSVVIIVVVVKREYHSQCSVAIIHTYIQ